MFVKFITVHHFCAPYINMCCTNIRNVQHFKMLSPVHEPKYIKLVKTHFYEKKCILMECWSTLNLQLPIFMLHEELYHQFDIKQQTCITLYVFTHYNVRPTFCLVSLQNTSVKMSPRLFHRRQPQDQQPWCL